MSRVQKISGMIVLLVAGRIEAGAQASPEQPQEHVAVSRIVNEYADAWNKHDMNTLGQLFAPDADFVNVGGYRWKGRDALQKNHAYMHGTIAAGDRSGVTGLPERHGAFRESTLAFTNIDVKMPTPNVAIAHATCRLTGHAASGTTGTTAPRTCIMTLVLIRNGDLWRISAAQNTETTGIR
jgi:ketosteroid isomerase-like protein